MRLINVGILFTVECRWIHKTIKLIAEGKEARRLCTCMCGFEGWWSVRTLQTKDI